MDLEHVKVMIDTPEQVFAEYEFTAQSSKTGRTIHGLFFGRLVAENGKIKLLRESINLVELALGVFPNGLADYKVPSERRQRASVESSVARLSKDIIRRSAARYQGDCGRRDQGSSPAASLSLSLFR